MKVLVIGDIIEDRYIYGTSSRISPEAPVPVITYKEEKTTMGGAALVYENLKSLGVDVTLFETGQPHSVKTRVICDGHYVCRIDDDKHADWVVVTELVRSTLGLNQYDYVILSDYGKGTLDRPKYIIENLRNQGCKVIVDPKKDASKYPGSWLVKPNKSEFEKFNFDKWEYGHNIIITDAGNDVVARIDEQEYTIPVEQVEVNDVTGAGDCFLAAFVYALTKNHDYQKALECAVKGSAESVKHTGTYVLQVKDIQSTKVFTNGCFDIIHPGHIEMLKKSKAMGDWLVVGLNTDRSIKKLKGKDRPINSETDRKVMLESLDFVDEVILFDEDTPLELIKRIKPDIITKGGDYTVSQVVGNELAQVFIIPTVEGHSTTETIKRIKE